MMNRTALAPNSTGIATTVGIAAFGMPFLIGVLNAPSVHAQSLVAALPKFEVASVRAATQQPEVGGGPKGGEGARGGGGTGCRPRTSVDRDRANFMCQSVAQLVFYAFGMLPDRITGEDWSAIGQRFDVAGKMPEGATEEQAPRMVLSLLEERFKLAFHRGSREGPIYALVTAKGGLKLKPADSAAETAGVPQPSSVAMMNGVSFRQTRVPNPDGKGFTVIMNTPAMGNVREPQTPPEVRRWEAPSISAEGLAELLTIAVGGAIPVRDMTGLRGRYDVELELLMADSLAAAPEDFQDALFKAGQDALKKLGLQLERRKGPIEIVVVDHLERIPTEN
jgi:uncharacterized protein (TIGR03435 family)